MSNQLSRDVALALADSTSHTGLSEFRAAMHEVSSEHKPGKHGNIAYRAHLARITHDKQIKAVLSDLEISQGPQLKGDQTWPTELFPFQFYKKV